MLKSFKRDTDSNAATNIVERQTRKPRDVAPGTEIGYDPALIRRFMNEHKVLVDTVEKMRGAAVDHQFTDAQRHLATLKALLAQHLLDKNVRLYTYLSYCLKQDPEGHALMSESRRQMWSIGHTAMRFTKEYLELGITALNVRQFVKTLDEITAILDERIQREEKSLYTMYQPPGNFAT